MVLLVHPTYALAILNYAGDDLWGCRCAAYELPSLARRSYVAIEPRKCPECLDECTRTSCSGRASM
jgi:hypothetical protein